MAHKLGVLIVHGMGSQQPDYADAMIEELKSRLGKLNANPNDISWEPAYLAGVLQEKESALWLDLSRQHKLRYKCLRQFVFHALGDAIAYQKVGGIRRDVYAQIHDKIFEHIVHLKKTLQSSLSSSDGETPIVVMAESLGSYMISNYIWDRQQGYESDKYGGNPFFEMKTVAGIVTFGCNIPVFSLAYDQIRCITFPDPALERYFPGRSGEEVRRAAKWLNFYDPDDVLGFPLKPLSPSYNATVTEDVAINVGGILSFWNPLSHLKYWTDNDFTKPVARFLAGILQLL